MKVLGKPFVLPLYFVIRMAVVLLSSLNVRCLLGCIMLKTTKSCAPSSQKPRESNNNENDGMNDFEDKLMLNNTVVDNELSGTEVIELTPWKKIWNELKKGEIQLSSWLKAD